MRKILFVLSVFGLCAVSAWSQTIVAQGECGPTVVWTLNSSGVLNITGIGDMDDYDQYTSPFWNHRGSINKLIIGGDVTGVGEHAFFQCAKIKEVDLPKSMQNLRYNAFYGCSAIDSISLPDGINVGRGAFRNCYALKRVVMPGGIIDRNAFNGCDSLVDVRLGERVSSIGYEAFLGCDGLEEITLPSSVKSIGERAFYGIGKLARVTIEGGDVGGNAFMYCFALDEVSIGENVTSIGRGAFSNCTSLATLNLAEGLDSIASGAFAECSRLKRAVIPNSVQYMGSSMLDGCDSLTYLSLPFIGERPYVTGDELVDAQHQIDWLYFGQTSLPLLDTLELRNGVRLEYGAFSESRTRHIILPTGINYIAERAFYSCPNLKSVNIPEGVDSIRSETFKNSYLPDGVALPSTLTYIGGVGFRL